MSIQKRTGELWRLINSIRNGLRFLRYFRPNTLKELKTSPIQDFAKTDIDIRMRKLGTE